MKKSKLLISLLTAGILFGVASCSTPSEDKEISAVYELYKESAKKEGKEPLSFDEWVKSVKGEKGETGDKGEKGDNGTNGTNGTNATKPTITVGANGNWFINGVDTGKKANGENGTHGANGTNGTNGTTPNITVGENGNWFINGVDTGKQAKGVSGSNGTNGTNGTDATAPNITVGENGHWYIDGEDTEITAKGETGNTGSDALVSIGNNGNWYFNGEDTQMPATGENGVVPVFKISSNDTWIINGTDTEITAKGADGITPEAPVVTINNEGYWCVDGVSLGIKAQGPKGETGDKGDDGDEGKTIYQTFIEHYPHYTGTEEDFAIDMAQGNLIDLKPGHNKRLVNLTLVEQNGILYIEGDCPGCGEHTYGDAHKKTVMATFEVDETYRDTSHHFSYDSTTQEYTSTNKGSPDTKSYLDILIKTDGLLEFTYTSNGESAGDYLYFGPDDNEDHADKALNIGTSNNGKYSREVKAGDRYCFVYKKNQSTDYGTDCATIQFNTAQPVYNILDINSRGGEELSPIIIENGELTRQIAEPKWAGKFFDGWYLDEGYNTPYVYGQTFSGDQTVYAKWVDAEYVRFVDGGSDVNRIPFKPGTTPEMPENPTKDGYIFDGWYTDPTFADGTKYVNGPAMTGFTLYARWIREYPSNN